MSSEFKPANRFATCKVRSEAAGRTLLDYLRGRFSYFSAGQWGQMIEAGRLEVNGATGHRDSVLAAGDRITFHDVERDEPDVDMAVRVVFEDRALLVVNKPGNLPCHPAGRYFKHTLWHWLRFEARIPTPHFVNRLDRETSGLVVIAKQPASAAACQRQFEERTVSKRYVVVVEGRFEKEWLAARGYLVPAHRSKVRKKRHFTTVAPQDNPARACHTDFERLAQSSDLSVLVARPHTGQTHQIRATLCSLGFPVVGDKIYGLDETLFLRFIEDRLTNDDWQCLRLPRQALHASELHLTHPQSEAPLKLHAPLPPDMAHLIRQQFKRDVV